MKILLIFSLFLISVLGESSKEVTAYSGGGVKIKCKYKGEYKTNNKYFCKGEGKSCTDQIKTADKHTWVHEGRFSLYDDTSAKVFWVLMRELTVLDSGTYQCGVDIKGWRDDYKPVRLKVKKDSCCGNSISETVYVQSTVNISCSFPESHRSKPKFLCKKLDIFYCKPLVYENKKWINEGKLSLYDDQAKKILTVTIRDVTEQDSGEYWCGVESDWIQVYVTQIYLRVTGPNIPVSSTALSSPHFSVQDTKPPTSSTSTSASSPVTGSPSYTVISVLCVTLLLLLIGTSVLIVTLRKRRKKKQESSKGQPLQDFSHRHGDPTSPCYYEEIKDTRSYSVSHTEASAIYSTVNLTTNLSDHVQAVYANTHLPQNIRAIYATAQLPSSTSH